MAAVRTNSCEQRLGDVLQPIPPRALVLVVGNAGAGKTSFINCLTGRIARLDRDNPYYFHTLKDNVGIMKSKSLPNPRAAVDPIQVVFILTASVFKERELDFCEQMRAMEKIVVLIRTKVDNDLRGEQRSRPKSYNEREVLNEITMNCENKLSETGITGRVYLLDNNNAKKYDFPLLLEHLSRDLPLCMRESLNIVGSSDQNDKVYTNSVDHTTLW